MTSQDKGSHRYNRLTRTRSRNECATQITTSQRVTCLRPPQPPLDTTPRTHISSHRSGEAAPQQPREDRISCTVILLWAMWVGNPGQDPIPSHRLPCHPVSLLTHHLITPSVVPVQWAKPGTSPLHMGNLKWVGSSRPHLERIETPVGIPSPV